MKDKITIAFVAASTQGGGAERMVLNIMNSLSPDKYSIYFINTSSDPKPNSLLSHIHYHQYDKVHAKSAYKQLSKDLIEINPKYIFTTSIVVAYLLQLIRTLKRLKSKLFVRISVPPSELPLKGIKPFILRKINSYSLKKADLIIAQTEYSKEDIHKHYRVPKENIRVIRNIVDKDFLTKMSREFIPNEFKKDAYNIVASGALYSVKGFDLLIDAMKTVAESHEKAKLFILGDERYEEGYRAKLEQQIQTLNLENKVFLMGHKDNPYPYYKHADLFVLSSRKEGFPNVVLESLFLGTPVVATKCVDFSGVIKEGNGYTVELNSAKAIAEGMEKAIEHLTKEKEFNLENFNYENLFK